jgi:ribokinase
MIVENEGAVVVVVGSVNMDLTVRATRAPAAGETVLAKGFASSGGGKGANQAVAAARMGVPTRLVGCVGDDVFGARLARDLAAAGVGTHALTIEAETTTGLAVIVVDDRAENRIVVVPGANDRLDAGALADGRLTAAFTDASVLLVQLEIPLDGVAAAARLGRQHGMTVVLDPAPVPPDGLPDELIELATILTPNEHEAATLLGASVDDDASAAAAALELRARGARTVVVTLGARGAYWTGPDGDGWVRPPAVTALDTVGAGDAFNGALAAGLAQGHDLRAALRQATVAGALSVTRPGAQAAMPTRAEVEALLRR